MRDGVWRNWARNQQVRPFAIDHPASEEDLVALVKQAAVDGHPVKVVGAGHSFTDIALTTGRLVTLDRYARVLSFDTDRYRVTVQAGITLEQLNAELDRRGLAMPNLGDIAYQTVAGATSTSTHGTGARLTGLADQIVGLRLVTADGSIVSCSADEESEVFRVARVGLGALGIVTAVTFRVEPAFTLRAVEEPMPWGRVVDEFDALADGNEHFEAYWFPHTDRMLTKRNNRTDEAHPLSRLRAYVDDELLANTAFGVVNRVGDLVPRAVPRLNRLSSRALSRRVYSDVSHRVLTSPRRVVFREMEYAVPREVGMQALIEVRALVEQRGWHIGFPVEIRHAPADDAWLSTAHQRASVYLAFHVNARTDHSEYFAAVEQVLRAYDGRPHWGKLHTRGAADLAPSYPRFEDFLAVRDRVDPDRLFTNPYLERVLTR